ncbi:MAG: NYN domain-containing protein [Spirochaetia bacterium]|nr:NYN domain-containing protein [Spirochaetia bacterium]
MKLIIDGYNLMYRLELEGSLEQKRDEMFELLSEFKSVNPCDITVVFDGSRNPSTQRGREFKLGINVIYSARGETADDIIMEMAEKHTMGKAKENIVVSSDNRVRNFAVEHFMKGMTSDEFAEYLI